MLAKKYLFKTTADFLSVKKSGKVWVSRYLKWGFLNRDDNNIRFGFVIGKKFSKLAVRRNKIRRQLSRVLEDFLKKNKTWGVDIVLIPHPKNDGKMSISELKNDVENVLEREYEKNCFKITNNL